MMADWREHPKLKGRFHVDYPDDVQVLVHDGGPRFTDRQPELVWVTVTACDGDVFTARVLNQPGQLKTVEQGADIRFIAPTRGEHLLQVRERYLQERRGWTIQPCNKCGLNELFDAPSELIRRVFPDLPEGGTPHMFTAFCGACGGVQVRRRRRPRKTDDKIRDEQTEQQSPRRKWWQFWK